MRVHVAVTPPSSPPLTLPSRFPIYHPGVSDRIAKDGARKLKKKAPRGFWGVPLAPFLLEIRQQFLKVELVATDLQLAARDGEMLAL